MHMYTKSVPHTVLVSKGPKGKGKNHLNKWVFFVNFWKKHFLATRKLSD